MLKFISFLCAFVVKKQGIGLFLRCKGITEILIVNCI